MSSDPLAPLLDLPGVADSVEAARTAVDVLLGNRVLRRRSADVSAESLLRGAWASAGLDGAEVPLERVRAGQAGDEPLVQGALRVQAALDGMCEVWGTAPRQVLARMHALAAADLVPDRELLGRPRAAPGVTDRLDALSEVLTTTSVPAVVSAAIVHGELLALDAFPPVSGLVARAAARLTGMQRGLDPKSLVVLEAGHRELGAAYPEAREAYREGTPEGVARWLAHCAEATRAGARESIAICEALARG